MLVKHSDLRKPCLYPAFKVNKITAFFLSLTVNGHIVWEDTQKSSRAGHASGSGACTLYRVFHWTNTRLVRDESSKQTKKSFSWKLMNYQGKVRISTTPCCIRAPAINSERHFVYFLLRYSTTEGKLGTETISGSLVRFLETAKAKT